MKNMERYIWIELADMHLAYGTHLQVVMLRRGFTGIDIKTVGFLVIRYFPAFIADYTNWGQYTEK